jgi:Glycosyl transferase family 2
VGNSPLGFEAIWTTKAPPYEEVASLRAPVFLGPPVRPSLYAAMLGVAKCPFPVAAAVTAGIKARDLLSFALWRKTAITFGIRRVLQSDGSTSPLTRLLPVAAESRSVSPPAVGLAMMVQNEERRIARCLESVAGWVAEIVVVDGGSTDRTMDIAAGFGARIIERPFDGDYAAQRNVGLRVLNTPWILVLDADERLSADLPPILDHIASSGEADGAYIHMLNVLEGEAEPWFWPDRHLRFFRSGHTMVGRIHERISGMKRPVYLPLSGPFIVHSKTLSEQWDREKQYFEIDPSYYSDEDARRIRDWTSRRGDVASP